MANLSKEQLSFIYKEVTSRLNITDVAMDLGIQIGHDNKALCPINPEKTPSFQINTHTNTFFCFGCKIRGNMIELVKQINHCNYSEALEYFSGRYGITPPSGTNGEAIASTLSATRTLESFDKKLSATTKDVEYALRDAATQYASVFKYIYAVSPGAVRDVQVLQDKLIQQMDYSDLGNTIVMEHYIGLINENRKKLTELEFSIKNKIIEFDNVFSGMNKCTNCFAGIHCKARDRNNYSGNPLAKIMFVGDGSSCLERVGAMLGCKATDILYVPAYICQNLPDFKHVQNSDYTKCFAQYINQIVNIAKPSTLVIDERYKFIKNAIISIPKHEIKMIECERKEHAVL